VKKAYKFRFYPTVEQASFLRKMVGCCRYVYNRSLALRSEEWTQEKARLSGYDLHKKITIWKRDAETQWLSEVPVVTLQQSVNNLEVAFQNFFANRAKYPKFKKKSSGGSCRFTRSAFRIKGQKVRLAKTGESLNVRWSRQLPHENPSQCTVRLLPSGEWYISFLFDEEATILPRVSKTIGLDMGISALVTTSDGEKVIGAKSARRHAQRLSRAQKSASRKIKGSNNRRKAALKVARIHRKISDIRKDQLHKLTTRLVRENQSIAIEDLAVRNMLKNHKLAGSISDSSWGELKRMLEYKCKWYGRELVIVDRWFPSSKACHKCGHVAEKLPLNIREWECPQCGVLHDRDVNAAKNIHAAGTVVNACGGAVRPKL
jgi:putative transposase